MEKELNPAAARISFAARDCRKITGAPRPGRQPEVRVLSPEGKQIGVMKTRDALEAAKSVGLDLVEISANARPPVCRIIDYGKYMYEQSKKQKDQKTGKTKLKEVKFRVRTDQHDYMTKVKRAEQFLCKGDKVKLSLMFRGRENEHKELGVETLRRVAQDLTSVATADAPPRLMGRNVSMTLSPLPEAKRKPKYHDPSEHIHPDEEDEDHEQEDPTGEEAHAEEEKE